MTKQSSPKKQPLMLHSLLGALSFWGTATRAFLLSFLAAAVFIVALTEATTVAAADNEIMVLIYVLSCFLLLDFGYVTIARTYPIQRVIDVMALVAADVLLALVYIGPKIVVSQNIVIKNDPLIFIVFIPLVALSLRMLIGILFGRPKR